MFYELQDLYIYIQLLDMNICDIRNVIYRYMVMFVLWFSASMNGFVIDKIYILVRVIYMVSNNWLPSMVVKHERC